MPDADPPLYAALAAMYGLTPRHQLREDRRMPHDPPTSRVTAAYGADDDPFGPPSPPLEPEIPDPVEPPEPTDRPVYGADDDPDGPPSPPLQVAP